MAAARFYSSIAGPMDLTASIAPSDTSITVSTTTGLPGTTPFTLVLDPGTASEEIVTATNVSGLTITITRGVDGSSATSHSAGVGNVRHMATARDYREPQEHIAASVNVHGVGSTGSVVGTDLAQTLTNKTIASPTLTGTTSAAGVTASSVAVTTTSTAATALSVTAMPGATAPALDAFENAPLGATKARVKLAPGSTNIFQVTGNDYFLSKGGSLTVTKSGRVSVVGSSGVGEPSTPVLTLTNSDPSAVPTTLSVVNSAGSEVAKIDKDGNLTAPNLPTLMQSGQVTIVLPTAANNVSQGVTFPRAFGGTPRVVVSLSSLPGGSSKATVRTVGTSSTATTLWVENGDGTSFGTSNPVTVDWIAVF